VVPRGARRGNAVTGISRVVRVACAILVATAFAGCAHLEGGSRPAKLIGTLWWLGPDEAHRSAEAWKPDLDQMQALGFTTIILNGPYVGEDLAPGQADPMEAFFAEADRRRLTLFLDTLAAPEWWTLADPAPEVARARARIQRLQQRYGAHRSFGGWYIPYEGYVFWDKQATLVRTLYRDIAAACKEAAPRRPVLISPFFILDRDGYLGSFRWATPEEYEAFWSDTLRATQIDIVALQDSGEHLSCYTIDQRRPFFAAMKAACRASGKTFWGNVETGELDVPDLDTFVARYGRKTSVNDPVTTPAWRGVPGEKLRDKLRLVGDYTRTAITWGYQQFARDGQTPASTALYKEYQLILSK